MDSNVINRQNIWIFKKNDLGENKVMIVKENLHHFILNKWNTNILFKFVVSLYIPEVAN